LPINTTMLCATNIILLNFVILSTNY
jgi:hypothetical protein